MRLALISDIHGNLAALESVATDIKRQGVDYVVNLGDSLSGPLLPLETAQFLMAQPWLHLAGNHERQLLTQNTQHMGASDAYTHSQLTHPVFDWLASLPAHAQLEHSVFVCHGSPRSDVEYFLETLEHTTLRSANAHEISLRLGQTSASLIACGHTHIPRAMRYLSGQYLVNPGSVGLPAYHDTHPIPHCIETGSPDARYAIAERLGNHWHICLMSVPYPYAAMAQLAKIRGRLDWERALMTGYVT